MDAPLVLHPRHRIDIAPADIARALAACAKRDPLAARSLERQVSPSGEVIATLSVRSAFDLLLSSLALDPGGEVLLSAWTIPDMVRIVRAHGLVPVPLDCDEGTLAPSLETLRRAITPRSRVLVVAQLFGASVDLAPLASLARAHGLLVVDDDAQGFTGLARFEGDPSVDVSLHSFGTIKTATALGGGIVRVRDARLRDAMRARMSAWPVQPVARYAKKLATWLALVAPRDPRRYALLARAIDVAGGDLDRVMTAVSKGFPAETSEALLAALRHRPCDALCATLARRLAGFDGGRIERRREAGERMRERFSDSVSMLGDEMRDRTHWLVAVRVPEPDALVRSLRVQGFDAARGTTTLAAVPDALERPEMRSMRCASWKDSVVFLPSYPEVPERDRDRMVDAVLLHAERTRQRTVTDRGGRADRT